MLFDLPHGIEAARQHLEKAEVAERCELVPGSFFEAVPGGGDAHLLKSIIHDWNDERSAVILQNCRRAMADNARLLLVERIMPDQVEVTLEHQALARSDLNMLVAPGGQERTEAEFRSLLSSAGFRLARVLPTPPDYHVLEALPV